jgi:ribosome-associated translation inhibitor RaiA
MDTPLEIVFHNMPSSPTLESDIRKRVDKLDRLYEHLVGCRVSVEQLHRRHQTGNMFDVHIDMHVPGDELVVSHEPHHARDKFADPDVGIAVRNAFKAAERQLLDFKRKQRGEVKLHDAPFAGHRNSLMQRDFDGLKVGDRVHFVETVGDTGPIASKVWRAETAPG